MSRCLDPAHAPEASGGVVRLHAIVINEDLAIAPVTEQGAAEGPDLGWRVDPAGGLQVELAKLLQGAVLRFGQQVDAHGGGHFDGAVVGLVLFSGGSGFAVIAGASAAGGAFWGAVAEGELAGLGVMADDVGFAACGFHGLQGFEGGGVGFEPGGHVGPIDADMPGHVFLETGFQGMNKFFEFWRFHGLQNGLKSW